MRTEVVAKTTMRLNPRSNAEILVVLMLAAFLFYLIPKEWIVEAQ
jgi:hypothetical protein